MQFGAAGSTVHGPVETVKYCEFGARGGGGGKGGRGRGGGARSGGARGGDGFEHTRQPVLTTEPSEDQMIDPVPNVKAEGASVPLKITSVPAVLGKLSLSQHASVEKAVAVMLLPMASEVGVMAHVTLVDPAPVK
jgi:hypothetical protein